MGKKVFIIATMGLFSGDGAGCSARLLAKCGAEIVGGLHLKMPDCIGDEKVLKKTIEHDKKLINSNLKMSDINSNLSSYLLSKHDKIYKQ